MLRNLLTYQFIVITQSINGIFCDEFIKLWEFYDNENQWLIYWCLMIRVDYAPILLFVFGLLICCETVAISLPSGNTGVLHIYKAVTSMLSKNVM